MSWECQCPGSVERGREHHPGSWQVCPYCGRTREHVELLLEVKALLAGGLEAMRLELVVGAYINGWAPVEKPFEATKKDIEDLTLALNMQVQSEYPTVERGQKPGMVARGHPFWSKRQTGQRFVLVSSEIDDDTESGGWVVLRPTSGTYPKNVNYTLLDFTEQFDPSGEDT